jgi:hypothetical protein
MAEDSADTSSRSTRLLVLVTVKEAGERRKELGLYLRARREQALRSEYGLPPVARRRERGLRREEIAFLSGVSVTWYTWLEQGRDIRPSREVLEAVARTLHLSEAGRSYVLSLGGYSIPVSAGPAGAAEAYPPSDRT